jgi:hypothetical protein
MFAKNLGNPEDIRPGVSAGHQGAKTTAGRSFGNQWRILEKPAFPDWAKATGARESDGKSIAKNQRPHGDPRGGLGPRLQTRSKLRPSPVA